MVSSELDNKTNICMAVNSKIGSMVIVISAAIGGIVAVFQLGDRFFWHTPTTPAETTAAIITQDPVITATQPPETQDTTPAPKVELVPTTEVPLTPADILKQDMTAQLFTQLTVLGCESINLEIVTVNGSATEKSETTSGFSGYFLEGSVTLVSGETTVKLPLKGTGKGPTAQARALDMAAEQFSALLMRNSAIAPYCQKGSSNQ